MQRLKTHPTTTTKKKKKNERKENKQQGGTVQFAVACKVADTHTITLPKTAYIRIPSGVASPGVL